MERTADNPIPELPRYLRARFNKKGFSRLYRTYEAGKPCQTLAFALLLHKYRASHTKHLQQDVPDLKRIARQDIMERRAKT